MHTGPHAFPVLINGDEFRLTAEFLPYLVACELQPQSGREAVRQYDIERWTYQEIRMRLRVGETALDVGAYIGILSVLMSRCVGPSGRVIAFEPNPEARSHLATLLQVNGAGNVEVVPKAVAGSDGRAQFFQVLARDVRRECSTLEVGAAHFYLANVKRRLIEVPTVTIDNFLDAHGLAPSLIKIDVEGSEGAVLAGAMRTLRRLHPTIQLELHDIARYHTPRIMELLHSCGYRISRHEHQLSCV